MSRSILVTGGTGFLGSALVRRLVQNGDKVRVMDNNWRGAERRLADVKNKIEFVEADIRDLNAVKKACQGIDIICHLAFINGTEFFYSKPDLVLEVGVEGMLNVLKGAIEFKVPELILASSSEVYQTPPKIPTDESAPLSIPDPLNPRYSYGGGKIISELMAINYGRKHFKRTVIFRPHNVYGPDMGWEHVIPQFVLRMNELASKNGNGITFPIQGTGKEIRSFVYIDDFTNGLMEVINKGENLNIYHIGTMDEYSIEDVAREVGKYFGKEVKVQPGKLQKGGTTRRCPDIAKLKGLGYVPKISLSEGIKKTADWYVKNLDKKPK